MAHPSTRQIGVGGVIYARLATSGGTAVEINTQILDEILRPLLAPQKVRLWPVKWVVFTSYTNKVYRG